LRSGPPKVGYLVFLLLILSLAGGAHAQQTSSFFDVAQYLKSTIVTVFLDGSAEVNQTLALPANLTSLIVPLFTKQVGNVLAVNQAGAPLSYAITGGNLTVYSLGSTRVSLRYETDSLTTKQGTVWNVSFNSLSNVSLILPIQSTILSFSGSPTSISTVNGHPTVLLMAGSWTVGYGLPVVLTTTTASSTTSSTSTAGKSSTTTQSTQSGGSNPTPLPPQVPPLVLAASAVAVVAAVAAFFARSRLRASGAGGDLRFDDREILNFLKEKGGRVIEAEIRERFSLPRTSAWRQAKRLEKLGFVKISKLGTQNQVELLRGDFEQGPDSAR